MTKMDELELSKSEKEAIEELRARMPLNLDKEMYNDTYQFYLYLKEVNFKINEAEIMLKKTLEWRKKMHVESIQDYKPPKAIKSYFANNRIAFDKQGSLVQYLPAGKIDVKGLYMSAKFSDLEQIFLQIIEEHVKTQKKKRKTPNGPYPGCIHIYDMDGLSFANATDKKGIEYMIRILKIYEDYYPGFLDTVYVINISSYFMIPFTIIKSCVRSSKIHEARIFGADGWKEELLKIIDADQLPAFLGGKKTDPDGNPFCKTLVIQGGKIDEKFYIHKSKNPLTRSPGVRKLVLSRASFSEVELEVEEDGSLIEWEFETKTRDVGFGLFYKETVKGEENITELVPLLRINTEDYSETGVYRCEKAGTYIILFDNSYSWIRSKEIYYRAKIISSKEHQAALQN